MLGGVRLYSDSVPAVMACLASGAGWLVPDWPAPPGVLALCTTRLGGVSAPPLDSFNLGCRVGDVPEAVAANRQRLRAAVGAEPVFMRQVHGVEVQDLDAWVPGQDEPQADACATSVPGRACTIQAADCMPVLLADAGGRVVGGAHAGWRGLAGGVLEALVAHLRGRLPQGGADAGLLAWLGPCIGPRAFEVGGEVREAFAAHDPAAAACFTANPQAAGKWLADLQALARQRLAAAGVAAVYGNDGGDGWCTVTQESLFFSHRRDAVRLGTTGRMAACIWLG